MKTIQNKSPKTFVFIVEMPPILSKDSAKNRFSEGKEKKFSFLSVRFLSKSKTIQNKSPKTFVFINVRDIQTTKLTRMMLNDC